jgi:hypothetical protein
MKVASRSDLNDYGHDVTAETAPFPWAAALMGVLTVAVVAPFAWRSYRRTAEELQSNGPEAAPRRRSLDE